MIARSGDWSQCDWLFNRGNDHDWLFAWGVEDD